MKSKRPTKKDLQQAAQDGFDRGRYQSLERISKLEEENKRLTNDYAKIRIEAIRNICQAGSTVIEGMSKAYLSMNGHL